NAVEPRLDGITATLDAEFVPLALFEGLLRRLVIFQIHEPFSPALIVDASSPGAAGGVDLHLVAVNPAGGNLDFLAIQLHRLRLVEALAANLHPRVEGGIDLE